MPDLDHVTGLEPRSQLQASLERLTRGTVPLALVICDVVGLKGVNEHAGFLAGDAVLGRAADRLRAAAAGADLAARLGGDEMVAVFTGPAAAASADRTATVLSAPGDPPLRAAAVTAGPGEPPGPLIERLYTAMRRS